MIFGYRTHNNKCGNSYWLTVNTDTKQYDRMNRIFDNCNARIFVTRNDIAKLVKELETNGYNEVNRI